jgi:hypothetical protein
VNLSLELDDLTVSQDALRHVEQLCPMIEHVKNGGFWNIAALTQYALDHDLRVCPLIEINQFPDGRMMVHDGHHRVVSTRLGGRHFLRGDEYLLKQYSYDNYLGINFNSRWVTPFDPRSEIRVADFGEFKKRVFELFEIDKDEAIRYILDNGRLYKRLRSISGVDCLANRYRTILEYCENPHERRFVETGA